MLEMPRIAILGPSPVYHEHWLGPRADYFRLFGKATDFIAWQQADVSILASYDLVLPLLAWGYHQAPDRWFALLDELERAGCAVVNPLAVLRWNSDKAYLSELQTAGVKTVPSMLTNALSDTDVLNASSRWPGRDIIIKPTISGGAEGIFRLSALDAIPNVVAGKRMIVQPFMSDITKNGELSLFYFSGSFSHAVRKTPLSGDYRVQPQFGGVDTPLDPPLSAKMLAEAALTAAQHICGIDRLAYARVDMVRDEHGDFALMELELIEPALFLHFAPDHGAKLYAAVLTHI
jgi:glutathione synthase/RimK-type ligase-like ATP-grasp enzyme